MASAEPSPASAPPFQVLSEALQARIGSETAAGRVPCLMRLAANVWSLLQSLDALDAWTLARARPHQVHAAGEGEGERAAQGAAAPDKQTTGLMGRRVVTQPTRRYDQTYHPLHHFFKDVAKLP